MRLAFIAPCLLLAAACSMQPERRDTTPPPRPAFSIDDWASQVVGRFSDHFMDQDDSPVVHEFRHIDSGRGYLLHQRHYPEQQRESSRVMAYPLPNAAEQDGADPAVALQADENQDIDSLLASPQTLINHLSPLEQCPMRWRRSGTDWVLHSPAEAPCKMPSANSPLSIDQSIRFANDTLTIDHTLYRPDQESVSVSSEYRRIQRYAGWLSYRDRLSHQPERWRRQNELQLDDDGQFMTLKLPTSGRSLNIELSRQLLASTGMEILQIKVYEREQLLASAWASPNSDNIGLHLDWLQVGLQRASE